jgi:hypothetical protein
LPSLNPATVTRRTGKGKPDEIKKSRAAAAATFDYANGFCQRPATQQSSNTMADFKFACPHCQQHIQADEGYAGLQIQCPSCQGSLIVPGTAPAPAPAVTPPPQRPAAARLATSGSASPTAPAAAHGSSCPSCGAALARGAVLCVNCGYNLTTKQRTVAGRPAAMGKPSSPSGATPWYLSPWPYLGVVIALLGVFYYLGRENPPMMLGFAAVALVYILGVHIITTVHAFSNEGIGTGFLTLCIPLYAIYYVFKVCDSDTLKVLYGFSILLNIGLRVLSKMAS